MMSRIILAVVAHPDDCELTCGATLARWGRDGDTIVLIVATDGALGGKVADSDKQAMIRIRRAEQEEAAAVLRIETVVFLGFRDGELTDDRTLRGALVEQIRGFRPDVAMVMDPLNVIQRNSYVNHRDHRILGMAMLDALYPEASNAGYYPEQLDAGLKPHKVPELLLANPDAPNYWMDVSETLETRFDALRRHRSQIKLWPEHGEAVIRQQRELASILGIEHGTRYVEEFRRVVVNPLA